MPPALEQVKYHCNSVTQDGYQHALSSLPMCAIEHDNAHQSYTNNRGETKLSLRISKCDAS